MEASKFSADALDNRVKDFHGNRLFMTGSIRFSGVRNGENSIHSKAIVCWTRVVYKFTG